MIGIDIQKAASLLTRGEVVAIPTETVYGLAANALDPDAVLKIYEVKKRPHFNPLIIHVADINQAQQLVESFPDQAKKLAQAFWPGPLTLVLPKSNKVHDVVTAGNPTVAIRVPRHPITLELLSILPFPLAAPSANPFGFISPTSASHVEDQLGDFIPYILDGGSSSVGLESTIIRFDSETPEILRWGGLDIDSISKISGPLSINTKVTTQNPIAPGQLNSHYAPQKKLVLGDIHNLLPQYNRAKVGLLSLKEVFKEVPADQQIQLSPEGNLNEAAKNLFAAMRTLDKLSIDIILVEPMPNIGLGKAINDRLKRAAA